MMEACLTFSDLTLGYAGHAAVHHLNGEIFPGSMTAVIGANGSGKSTLMKGIANILRPLGGQCTLRTKRLAYLPQQTEIDRTFPARVIDLVSLGFWQKTGLLGRRSPEDRKRLQRCLEAVGLTGFENRAIDSLSGGQMQRALFARTMLQDADLILLDEPFNAVDQRTVRDLITLMEQWVAEGRTVLCVLHDQALVSRHFPQTLLLARRAIAFGPTTEVLSPENLRRAQAFHEQWDEQAQWCVDEMPLQPDENNAHDHSEERRVAAHV